MYGPITYDLASLVRDAFISWEEERALDWIVALLGEGARAPGCRWTRISATSTAISNGWGCSAISRCSASSRASATATASRGYLEDTPRFIGYVRAVAARYRALAPLAQLLDRARGPRRPAHEAGPYESDDPCRRARRAHAPAHRRDAQAAARGRRQAADRVAASSGSRATGFSELVINHAHLGAHDRSARSATDRASGVRIRYSPERAGARDRRRHRATRCRCSGAEPFLVVNADISRRLSISRALARLCSARRCARASGAGRQSAAPSAAATSRWRGRRVANAASTLLTFSGIGVYRAARCSAASRPGARSCARAAAARGRWRAGA